jgi:site-specific DNA-methyltransferase (adenine-specific)
MNTFYHGDCLFVMKHDIEPESVDLIYLDPPFFTGKVQKGKWKGEWHPEAMEISFEDSKSYWSRHLEVMRQKAPIWLSDIGRKYPEFGAYLYYMMQRLQACHRVLRNTGSIYLHCDWRASHYLKVVMDEVFGESNFQNEIIWAYKTQGATKKRFSRKHDTILFYSKSDKWIFNTQYEKSFMKHKYGFKRSDFKIDPETGQQYNIVIARDIWEIPALQSATSEKLGYPTQKPEALLTRIINASSKEGDIVLDPFCGCGTTVIAASKLNRQFIGIDIDTSERKKGELPKAFTVIKNRSHELFSQASYISRDLKEVQEMSHREFEAWVNEFYKANKPQPDRGVDGITSTDGVPIQTKTFLVGYEVVDKLLSSSKYHPLVPKPIKKIMVVSQVGFDDSAVKRKFQIEHTDGIEVTLTTPEQMLSLET